MNLIQAEVRRLLERYSPEHAAMFAPEPAATPDPQPAAVPDPEPAAIVDRAATLKPERVATSRPEPAAPKPDRVAASGPRTRAPLKPEPVATVKPEPAATLKPEPVATLKPERAATLKPAHVAAAKPASVRLQAHPAAIYVEKLRASWRRLNSDDRLEGLLPVALIGLLVLAVLASTLPVAPSASAAARQSSTTEVVVQGGAGPALAFGQGDGPLAADVNDVYYGDGSIPNTLQNPGQGTDARSLLHTYSVRAGDTLNIIAGRFGLAPSTIYWANKATMPDPAALRVGQTLLIPPMDGLIITVGAKDSLESLAAKYKITTQDIIDANNLPEAKVTAGQTLIMPGASGGAMPKPKAGGSGGYVAPGRWKWPVGGDNYVSQYFWSSHRALDIAASYGTPVYAAASGTVYFAGWRSYNQGGNVVWIIHSAKLWSTYNHLSAWKVRSGQKVSAGQLIGYIGTSGMATGPHLHLEVWLGQPWALGTNSNAVNPCAYLAGC